MGEGSIDGGKNGDVLAEGELPLRESECPSESDVARSASSDRVEFDGVLVW